MDIPAFEDLLDRHGGDPAKWPAASGSAAAALLEASPRARQLLKAMADVEAFLNAEVGARDVDRFAATAMRHRQISKRNGHAMRTGWGAVAAAMLLCGYLVGDLSPNTNDDSPDRVMAVALDATGSVDVD